MAPPPEPTNPKKPRTDGAAVMRTAHESAAAEYAGRAGRLAAIAQKMPEVSSDELGEITRLVGPSVTGALFHHFGPGLGEADSQAALSDALSRLWQYRQSYSPDRAPLDVWVTAIAMRCARDLLKRRGKGGMEGKGGKGGSAGVELSELAAVETTAETGEADEAEGKAGKAASPELLATQRWLNALPKLDRTIMLAFARGDPRSWAETLADQLRVSPVEKQGPISAGAIRVRKSRLMGKLKEHLGGSGPGTEPHT